MKDIYLDSIRRFEGFSPVARQDCTQLSNGYGTRARFAGETLTAAEAESRFKDAISSAEKLVEGCAPDLDEGTKAALTSLTFNTGVKWIHDGLGDAIRKHDLTAAREIFQHYTTAAGQVLPGLVSRRSEELAWFGGGVAAQQAPGGPPNSAASASTGSIAAADPVEVSTPIVSSPSQVSAGPTVGPQVVAATGAPSPAMAPDFLFWWHLMQQAINPSADTTSDRRVR
jgi:lysozyme